MTRFLSILAVVLALGCGGTSDGWTYAEPAPLSRPTLPTSPEDLAHPAPPATDAREQPRIDVDALLTYEGPAATHHLPASSEGRVALPVVDPDGARGNPNLTLRVVDTESGETTSEIVVLTPEEWARASGPDELGPVVEERAARAQRVLDEGGFGPLPSVYGADAPAEGPIEATGAGVRLEWNPSDRTLVATDEATRTERLRTVVEPAAPVERGEACPTAHAPVLRAAWIDTANDVLVARVAFMGNDACQAPPDRWSVFRLAPLPAGADESGGQGEDAEGEGDDEGDGNGDGK